jgi:probable rRNA maturation factor
MTSDEEQPIVLISNRQDVPVDESDLSDVARRCLLGEGLERVELSVSLVGPDEIADLHERYMREPGPTDVLSFPMEEDDDGVRLLGDVVICPEVAAKNNDDLAAELRLLVVHGILHLLGHDHEEDEERAEMWVRQERYTGVKVP